jgi:hypothetical protein
MNTQQTLVAYGGMGLIVGNFWTTQRHVFAAGAFNSSASTTEQESAHSTLVKIGAEVVFVAVATLLAGTSKSAGNAMAAIIAALAIVWLIKWSSNRTTTH